MPQMVNFKLVMLGTLLSHLLDNMPQIVGFKLMMLGTAFSHLLIICHTW